MLLIQLAGDSKLAPACILCTYGETENKVEGENKESARHVTITIINLKSGKSMDKYCTSTGGEKSMETDGGVVNINGKLVQFC